MNIKIKRIDKTLPLPKYETPGSVAFDLYSREDVEIAPQSIGFAPSNLIIKTPPEHVLIVASRSSTPKRKGLIIAQGIGIIDQDYCGEEDEIILQFYNFTSEVVKIEKGERIGQALFMKISKAEWEESESMEEQSRGGYGSTGY